MTRESYPVSGLKVASVSCDPLEKGKNPGSYLAWETAKRRRTHEALDCLHLAGDSVQQIGRAKEWAGVGCVVRIAGSSLEIDDVDSRAMIDKEELGWSCRFSS